MCNVRPGPHQSSCSAYPVLHTGRLFHALHTSQNRRGNRCIKSSDRASMYRANALQYWFHVIAHHFAQRVASIRGVMDFRRHTFQHDGLTLSYLDTGSAASSAARPALLAIHAHLMDGATYTALA